MIKPKTERLGIAFLDYFFAENGWIFREQPILDYGIDAHIEFHEDDKYPSGILIAVQIKSGESYFNSEDKEKDAFVFSMKEKHDKYWKNHSLPVIIILYHPVEKQGYWQSISSEIESSDFKVFIPKSNTIKDNKDFLKKLFDLYDKHLLRIVNKYIESSGKNNQNSPEFIEMIKYSISSLIQGKTSSKYSEIQKAVECFERGDLAQAMSLFEIQSEYFEKEAKKGAEIQRNIGTLAFLDNTQKSLKAYRRATQLDPENADGWNQLGHLLKRIDELDEAINAYQTVLRLGEAHKDQKEIAAAYGNLGVVYKTRGDLDKAVEYYNKAFEIDENLGCKAGMASGYGNLGNVYLTRGDLDKAVEYYNKSLEINESLGCKEGMASGYGNLGNMYLMCDDLDKAVEYCKKSLEINESLGRKEGMAIQYNNLAAVYEKRKDYKQAREYWEKSLALYKALGSPMAKQVQSWLDSLPR